MTLYDQCHPGTSTSHGTHLCRGFDLQALLAEKLGQGQGDLWLVAGQDGRSARHECHLGTEASEHLAQFKGNVTPTQDKQRAGKLGQLHLLLARQQVARKIWGLGQPWDTGDEWRG